NNSCNAPKGPGGREIFFPEILEFLRSLRQAWIVTLRRQLKVGWQRLVGLRRRAYPGQLRILENLMIFADHAMVHDQPVRAEIASSDLHREKLLVFWQQWRAQHPVQLIRKKTRDDSRRVNPRKRIATFRRNS